MLCAEKILCTALFLNLIKIPVHIIVNEKTAAWRGLKAVYTGPLSTITLHPQQLGSFGQCIKTFIGLYGRRPLWAYPSYSWYCNKQNHWVISSAHMEQQTFLYLKYLFHKACPCIKDLNSQQGKKRNLLHSNNPWLKFQKTGKLSLALVLGLSLQHYRAPSIGKWPPGYFHAVPRPKFHVSSELFAYFQVESATKMFCMLEYWVRKSTKSKPQITLSYCKLWLKSGCDFVFIRKFVQ